MAALLHWVTTPHVPCSLHLPLPCPMLHLTAANGWLEDVTKVDKYVMSDEAYASRDNTYRK